MADRTRQNVQAQRKRWIIIVNDDIGFIRLELHSSAALPVKKRALTRNAILLRGAHGIDDGLDDGDQVVSVDLANESRLIGDGRLKLTQVFYGSTRFVGR
jgi:hypothetical protein